MSTEQQDRQAVQYAERVGLFTLRKFVKLCALIKNNLSGDKTAYSIGSQKLEDLLKTPYHISSIKLDDLPNLADSEMDFEKFNQLMQDRKFPLAFAWEGNTLYFYSKDKSVLDDHLERLLEDLAKNPDLFKDLVKDKDLNEEISKAKEDVIFEKGAVKEREIIR